ncbi:hypothetical protein [Eubacterium sp.]|uniref:hypothetical protein n=1 Tax=Eubacterium sp. TaxID=142586 RepID=UPI0026E05D4E|nr:hypothetical protein [Eubacterium sp.]MDO5433346.1 hypothetical protein [Eubacterium sp.]
MGCNNCLCETCANNVESLRKTSEEMKVACFACDECFHFDHDTEKKNNGHPECPLYQKTKYHINQQAKKNRRKIKLIKSAN